MERLDKFLCEAGAGTRSQMKQILKSGRVTVDGSVERDGSRKIDPAVHKIALDGVELQGRCMLVAMLNKPAGFVTATQDRQERTVMELLPKELLAQDVKPVGRLDKDTEGLLLMTDDGELTNRLTHPRHEIPKIYHVTVSPAPSPEILAALASPMELDGYRLLPIGVHPLSRDVLELTLYEGRNRQIRRMCDAVGLRVRQLRRVAIGKLTLGDLPLGKWRELTEDEVQYLMNASQKERN